MIHGPCGNYNPLSPCMKDGRCTKGYPKPFNESTFVNDKGFPVYRRRMDSPTGLINDNVIDSSWVVPYNVDLLLRFEAHTNVEICNYGRLIKYLFKYVHKGPDRATAPIKKKSKKTDEIEQYLDSRYIGTSEAAWRLFEFKLRKRYTAVQRLQYHLSNQQMVFFHANETIEDIVDSTRNKKTMFTEWFVANQHFSSARELLYRDFPRFFVWNKEVFQWKPRKQVTSIGRLPFAHPASGDRYYLRILLGSVKGPTSFEDIRTVGGVLYPDFKSACRALGLLEDDNEWDTALEEASIWSSAYQLRCTFVVMLLFCEIISPRDLWNKHWSSLSEDYAYTISRQTSAAAIT